MANQTANPVILDVSGYAGISTHAKDARLISKRVRGITGRAAAPVVGRIPQVPPVSAGLTTQHLTELQLTQHRRSIPRSQAPQQPQQEAWAITAEEPAAVPPKLGGKPLLRRYATDRDYVRVFDTRWRADETGRMALFLSRKPGNAALEANPDKLDMINTFHRERGSVGSMYKPDHLCNEGGFVTGTRDAATLDVLKPIRNRAAPYDNPDGPFETIDPHVHPSRADHLDRTCSPKEPGSRDQGGGVGSRGLMRVCRERSQITFGGTT